MRKRTPPAKVTVSATVSAEGQKRPFPRWADKRDMRFAGDSRGIRRTAEVLLGLEIPCSIHLSYGREGVFGVSRGPLLAQLLAPPASEPHSVLPHAPSPAPNRAAQAALQASAVRSAFRLT
jgi:hypothetical protein